MLKLPVCPHCHAVYSYKEVRDMKQGSMLCYHCKKKFSVNKKLTRFIFLAVVCAVLIIFNLAVIFSTDNISIVMIITDMVFVTAAVLMSPLTVRFKPEKMTKSEKNSVSENKKRGIKNGK